MKTASFRKAVVIFGGEKAGVIEEIKNGYRFIYEDEFIKKNKSISISLPSTQKIYESSELPPFFLGLLPEGWYLEIVSKKLKIDKQDAFGLLLATCKDTIGAVSVEELK